MIKTTRKLRLLIRSNKENSEIKCLIGAISYYNFVNSYEKYVKSAPQLL